MQAEQTAATEAGFEPWPGILTQPGRALQLAAERGSWKTPAAFLLLTDVAKAALEHFTSGGTPAASSPAPIVEQVESALLIVGAGAAMILVVYLLVPWRLGRMIGGRATASQVLSVMVWSAVPAMLLTLPLDLLGLELHGSAWWSMHARVTAAESWRAMPASVQLIKLTGMAVSLWGAGLQIIGLAEVHRFSKPRAAVVVILPVLLVLLVGLIATAMAD